MLSSWIELIIANVCDLCDGALKMALDMQRRSHRATPIQNVPVGSSVSEVHGALSEQVQSVLACYGRRLTGLRQLWFVLEGFGEL